MTHHANQWILMLAALMVLVIVGLSGNVVGTVSFDKNNIISDAEFEDYTSMSQNAIQSFLESKGSALASYQTERAWNKNTNSWGDTTVIPASQIIYEASVDNRLNPKVILTMLHKEQSLIESGNLNGVNLACGYDPGNSYYSGFGKQVWSCAWQLRQFFDSAAVGDELIAVHDGNLPVYPADRATYALYRYNPSIGDPNDVTSGQGGNYNFWLIWTRWGFGDVTQFTTPTLNLPIAFNQRNYNQQLGTCTGCTIASDGCAVTSLAMVLKYFGITVTIPPEHSSTGQKRIGMDPSVLDDWLTWNGGYSNGCLMKWTVLPPGVTASRRQYNPSTTGISPQTSAYFDNALANGDPVIAGVHWSGRKIDSHFVVIASRNGNTYNIIDPYGGVATTLDNGVLGQYIIDHYRSFSGPSHGGTPLVSISKTIRSDSDNVIDLTTSDLNDGSRDVIFNITLTNTGTVDARVTVEDNLAKGDYYIADPTGPPPLTNVTVPAGGIYSWAYRARYKGSATADRTPITNTAHIIWIHNYYNELTHEDYGGHGALTSSQTAYIHNPSQPSQGLSADLNCDGKVDRSDSGILMSYWGTDGSGATSCRSPDINQDGIVNSLDLNMLKSQWTQPNETPVARITMTLGSETAYDDEVLELTVPSGGTATVHFSASRSSDPDGTISSYQWLINGQPAGNKCDFDSNLPEGTYDIFLTVTDKDGAEDSVGASIIITSGITAKNDPPTAGLSMTSGSETAYEDAVLELTVPSGGTATVHFSASRSSDPDGSISSYQWLINGQSANNLRDFDSNLGEGTHQIYLTVTDNGGAEDSVGASIIITTAAAEENEPPTARITITSGSETAYEDEVLELTVPSGGAAKVDFSASRSTDSDGSISSYKWYIGGSHVSSSRDFSYNLGEGTHQIYLTVTDNKGAEGSVGASVRITATNNPPTAGITMTSGSKTAYENQVLELTVPSGGTANVDFSASRSTDPDGSISSYKWYISGSHVSSSRDFSYNLGEGTHQIYLTVTDNKGAEGSVGASVRITATNEPPTAGITMTSGSKTAYENQILELTVPSGGTANVDFSASRSTDPDGSISSYKWYISGSHVSSSRDFSYNLGEGTHQIYLTVTDNKGAEDSVGATVRITATNNPPTAGITVTSGSKIAYENQVLELTVPSGGTANVDFSASRSTDPDGSISSYKWYISGSHVSSSRDFSYNLGEGTHQIFLTVTDNEGAEGSVGASVKIIESVGCP